jgi:predicted patatin/cPLA2 family phospholipase
MKKKTSSFLILPIIVLAMAMIIGSTKNCGGAPNEIAGSVYSIPDGAGADTSKPITFEYRDDIVVTAALVLEGGALRSLYTSGVLDVFMENGLEFSGVIGVSAGALNAANYVAKHIGRSAKINIMHSGDSNYFGIKQFLLKGSVFNFDYLFYTPIKDLYPYAEDVLEDSKQRFLIGATDCETGKAVYFEKKTYIELIQALQASSSIPLLCKPFKVDGVTCLDGAISDPIGVNKAFSEGYNKVVVVLTRHYEYKNKKPSRLVKFLYNIVYKKYPRLIASLDNNYDQYNSLIEEINKMEKEDKIFIIRPSCEKKIKSIEKDARKLTDLYFLGRDDARRLLPQMLEYINR